MVNSPIKYTLLPIIIVENGVLEDENYSPNGVIVHLQDPLKPYVPKLMWLNAVRIISGLALLFFLFRKNCLGFFVFAMMFLKQTFPKKKCLRSPLPCREMNPDPFRE